MRPEPLSRDVSHLTPVEEILVSDPQSGELPGGVRFASCLIRVSGAVGDGAAAQNTTWPLVVHRPVSVEIMKAAQRGDLLDIVGAVQDAKIIIPRNGGQLEIAFSD